MDRRSFLQLGASVALGTIWLPGVMRNASSIPQSPAVLGWGIGIPAQEIWTHGTWLRERILAVFQPGTWVHWHALRPSEHQGLSGTYLPMVYNEMWVDWPAIRQRFAAFPDEFWLMLNEPERPEQANMGPVEAVDLYEAFQALAPATVRYTAPGVAVGTLDYDGLAWLTAWQDMMRQRGLPMPHVWNIHMYQSGSLSDCQWSWDRWQEWHQRRGDGKPVVITELCAMESDYRHQVAVMDWGRQRLAAGDVETVLWYSSHSWVGTWQQCALATYDVPTRRVMPTRLGEHWQDLNQN